MRCLRYLCNLFTRTTLQPETVIKWEDTVEFTFPITGGKVIKVYDADTITIATRLPFNDSPLYRLSVRLNGIDAPEIKGKDVSDEEKEAAIKELVEYATANGAKNAQFYYPNITIMTNKVIGIDKGQRYTLDTRQLCVLQMIETSIRIAIGDGLREQLDYHDIFDLCKDRVSELQPLLKLN